MTTEEAKEVFDEYHQLNRDVSMALYAIERFMERPSYEEALKTLLDGDNRYPPEFGMYVSGLYDSHCD